MCLSVWVFEQGQHYTNGAITTHTVCLGGNASLPVKNKRLKIHRL